MSGGRVLGLDVGGANLKAATAGGVARIVPFELWKHPRRLAPALSDLVESFGAIDRLAVTMTGELCDCFATKREGVHHILAAVRGASRGRAVFVWLTDGRLAPAHEADGAPLLAAASNWLASATFAARLAPAGTALFIDVGSTTTDIVPIAAGRPVPQGRDDTSRMRASELVYTGVRRTPLCALMGPRGMAEFFATTLDVYLLLGLLPEDGGDLGTADRRPATAACAHARLARMLGGDGETIAAAETRRLAAELFGQERSRLAGAMAEVASRLPEPPRSVILAGSGEFLAREAVAACPALAGAEVIRLSERWGEPASVAACAFALASLGEEMLQGKVG